MSPGKGIEQGGSQGPGLHLHPGADPGRRGEADSTYRFPPPPRGHVSRGPNGRLDRLASGISRSEEISQVCMWSVRRLVFPTGFYVPSCQRGRQSKESVITISVPAGLANGFPVPPAMFAVAFTDDPSRATASKATPEQRGNSQLGDDERGQLRGRYLTNWPMTSRLKPRGPATGQLRGEAERGGGHSQVCVLHLRPPRTWPDSTGPRASVLPHSCRRSCCLVGATLVFVMMAWAFFCNLADILARTR